MVNEADFLAGLPDEEIIPEELSVDDEDEWYDEEYDDEWSEWDEWDFDDEDDYEDDDYEDDPLNL